MQRKKIAKRKIDFIGGDDMKTKNITGEGTFKYYDEVPVIIFNGKNFERSIYGDEARELYLKIIGLDKKDER